MTEWNETQQTIMARRTVHDYLPTPVPEEAIERALRCAVMAPNHKLTNPWRFTRVGDEARAAIAELGVRLKSKDRALPEVVQARIRKKLLGAPELIIVTQVRAEDDFRAGEDYGAIACALQNAMLSLASEGLGTKWSTGGVTRHEETYALAQVPAGEQIVGFLWIGYPEREDCPVPPRAPLELLVRRVS